MFSGHTSCITLLNFFITECKYTLKIITFLPCTRPHGKIGSESDYRSRGYEFDPSQVQYFRGFDHEIFSTVILLLLIQVGMLSVTSKSMCTKYWLTALLSLPRKRCP